MESSRASKWGEVGKGKEEKGEVIISLCGSESRDQAEGSESVEKADESEGVRQLDESEIVAEQQGDESAEQEYLPSTSTMDVIIQDAGTQMEVLGVLTEQLSISQSKIATLHSQAIFSKESL